MRRFSVRALMGSVVWLAVALAVLKNGNELGLGMVLLVGLAALGTRWPYRVHPDNAEESEASRPDATGSRGRAVPIAARRD